MCKEYGVECSDKWYEHYPKSVEENEDVTLLWAKETIFEDIAVPRDSNVLQKETEKYEKYQDLAREM